jgi:pimeloyl-ACP methyl ester carboxylesterase
MAVAKKKVWRIFKIVLIIYVLIGFGLYYLQDKLLFHPKPLPIGYRFHFAQPFLELNLPVARGRNLSVLRFTVDTNRRKGIVLFFHGNQDNSERYAVYAPVFTRQGYEAWFIDYPGFGKTTGDRKEEILYQDALTLYKMAIQEVPSEKIVIYGKSLGSGIASQLSSVRDCKALMLETPYYSFKAIAAHYFPIYPTALAKYELPVYAYLKTVQAPVYIFHGTEDGLLPYAQSQRLAAENKQVILFSIPGGDHNNLLQFPAFRKQLDSLLIAILGKRASGLHSSGVIIREGWLCQA